LESLFISLNLIRPRRAVILDPRLQVIVVLTEKHVSRNIRIVLRVRHEREDHTRIRTHGKTLIARHVDSSTGRYARAFSVANLDEDR